MLKIVVAILAIGIAVFSTSRSVATAERGNFISLRLPTGVSVDVPRTWTVLDSDGRVLIETSVQAIFDLSRLPLVAGKPLILARSPAPTYASMNLVVSPGPTETQAELKGLSVAQIRAEDELTREAIKVMSTHAGWRLVEWLGTRRETLDKHLALLSEYRRQFPGKPIVRVQIYAVPLGTESLALTLEYREDERGLWYPVIARIHKSFRVGPRP